MKLLGPILRRYRKVNGLTLRALALRSGVSHTTIHHIETGYNKQPEIKTVKKLQKALGREFAKEFGERLGL